MKLWVDDLREAPPNDPWEPWIVVQTSSDAIRLLETYSWLISEMSLDHDLGGVDTTRAVVLWLCENPGHWPKMVRVHSANPVGREWLEGMIARYKE